MEPIITQIIAMDDKYLRWFLLQRRERQRRQRRRQRAAGPETEKFRRNSAIRFTGNPQKSRFEQV